MAAAERSARWSLAAASWPCLGRPAPPGPARWESSPPPVPAIRTDSPIGPLEHLAAASIAPTAPVRVPVRIPVIRTDSPVGSLGRLIAFVAGPDRMLKGLQWGPGVAVGEAHVCSSSKAQTVLIRAPEPRAARYERGAQRLVVRERVELERLKAAYPLWPGGGRLARGGGSGEVALGIGVALDARVGAVVTEPDQAAAGEGASRCA